MALGLTSTHRLRLTLVLALLFVLGWASVMNAQTVSSIIRQYEMQDRLNNREVTAIFEDPSGMIWLGTERALQRYDGFEFQTWTGQRNHPMLRQITTLGMDRQGWLWVWNNAALEFVFFNTFTEEFQNQTQRFGKDFPIFKNRNGNRWLNWWGNIPVDSKGRMVFPMCDPAEIIFYSAEKGFETSYLDPEIKSNLNFIALDSNDDLWFVSDGAQTIIYRVGIDGRLKNKTEIPWCRDFVREYLSKDRLVFQGSTAGGFQQTEINLRSGEVKSVFSKDEYLRSYANGYLIRLFSDRWVVTPESSPDSILLTYFTNQFKRSFSEQILHLFEDSKGRKWIGGQWGLTVWDLRPSKFERFVSFDESQEKPFQNSVRGIYASSTRLYANMESVGVIEVPLNNPSTWRLLNPVPAGVDARKVFLSSRPLIKLDDGTLQFAQSALLINVNPVTGQQQLMPLDKKIYWHIWSLYEDASHNLWIGGEGVLGKLKPGAPIETIALWNGNVSSKIVYQILPDRDGNFWLSTSDGLLLFDPTKKQVIDRWGSAQQGAHNFPTSVIHHHHIDADQIHWLATDNGLLEWNPRDGSLKTYGTLDGLSSEVVYGVFEDKHQQLWLSSEYGIMRFHKKNHSVRSYLENEGIAQSEFNRISCFQDSSGRIFFGGMNGITAFRPEDFGSDTVQKPVLQITGFDLFFKDQNQPISRVGELRRTSTISFGPNVAFMRLQFAIPNPLDTKSILYAWRIKENVDNWAYQQTNFIQLTTMAYGDFTLQVKGRDHTGTWSDPIDIKISVPRPFYLQTWFFILLALVFMMGAMLFFRWRTGLLRRRQQQLEVQIEAATTEILEDKQTIARQMGELQQLDETKSRFFANVAHEFRTPLTLIQGPLSSVLKSDGIKPENLRLLATARENTEALVQMINSILDLTKLESGKIDLHETVIELQPWLHRFVSGFDSLLHQKGIRFQFQYIAEPQLALKVDREKLFTILKNLLSNAIKFTPSGHEIQLVAAADNLVVTISIHDTGKGIPEDDLPHIFERYYQSHVPGTPAQGGSGIGLALSSELAKIMNAELSVTSTLGKGSNFTLKFPLRLPSEEELSVFKADLPITVIERPAMEVPARLHEANKATLLVVEDNTALLAYLVQILQPTYNLLQATNGKLALELLASIPTVRYPDLVISDVMMPEMDGFQLLTALKSHTDFGRLPVIMLTARAGLEDKLRALRIGVDDYLTKPFDEEELLTRVANLLGNALRRKEAQAEAEIDSSSEQPALLQVEREWLARLEGFVVAHLGDSQLSVTMLGSAFAMSESTLRRQVKRLTGLTPQEYIQEHKLELARQKLESGMGLSVAQVAEEVGFEDSKAFARSFKSRFGKPPSQYLKEG